MVRKQDDLYFKIINEIEAMNVKELSIVLRLCKKTNKGKDWLK